MNLPRLFFAAMVLSGIPVGALELETTIPMPEVEGRIDHLAVDVAGARLFVAALGNNTVVVVDLKSRARVRCLSGFREPQGLAWLPELRQLIVANGGGGDCMILSGENLELAGKLNFGDDADNVRYDAVRHRVFVGYGSGGIGVIDATKSAKADSIKLAGHPESFQLEKNGSRIFVNIPSARQIAVVDRDKNATVATWPLTGASANFPMALDEANGRIFIGCRKPAKMLVLDAKSGRTVTELAVGADTDDLFYDAKRSQIYVVCGEGTVSVIHQETADRYILRATVKTAPGARTGLFVPELDRLFVAVPHRGGQAAELRVYKP